MRNIVEALLAAFAALSVMFIGSAFNLPNGLSAIMVIALAIIGANRLTDYMESVTGKDPQSEAE